MENSDQPLTMSTASIAEVALRYPHALDILNRHNLDYCCDGMTSFVSACEARKINAENIWEEIQETKPIQEAGIRFKDWKTKQLMDFILEHHHRFIRKAIPELRSLLDTVCAIHGEDNITVRTVSDDFDDLVAELKDHLSKEEDVLFPAIRKLLDPETATAEKPALDSDVKGLIAAMEQEHHLAGELIKSLRTMTQYYTPPDYACATYRATYQLLRDFDSDLVQHIHLENNILFPRVKEAL